MNQKRMSKLFRGGNYLFLCLLLAAFLVACGNEETTPGTENGGTGNDGTGDTTGGGKTCSNDLNCQPTEYCDLITKSCKAKDGGTGVATCTSDANCAAGQKCNLTTGKCETNNLPFKCTSDANCAAGQTCNLLTGNCEGDATTNPPTSTEPASSGKTCTSDADCGTEKCVPSFSDQTKKSCRRACTPQQDLCGPNEGCAPTQMGGICVADECSWAKPCAGTNTCFPIDTDSSICIPSGQIPAGGDCTSNQNGCAQGALCVPIDQQQTKFECIMTCNPAQNTQCTDMDCKDISDSFKRATNSFGICMKKGTVDAYGDCDQNNPCKQPMMCVMLSQNATTGSCLNPCNVKNPQCTDKDEQCLPLQSGGDEGICYKQKPGNVAIDQSCGQAEGNCKEGLICLTLKEGDTSGTCLQKCVPGDTTVICPKAEQSCVPLQSGGGVCYAAPTGNSGKYQECGNDTVGYCKKDLMCVNTEADSKTGTCLSKCDAAKNNTDNTNAECVESGEKCFQLQNGEGICYKPPTGNNEKGAKCGSKAAGHCKEGLLCVLMAQGDTEGTCLTICDPANPQCDTDEQCMGLQGGGGVCSKQGMSTGSNDAGQSCGPKSGGCKTGLLCVKQSQTEEEGKCYISCDPANPSCPMPSQNCAPISAGSGGVCAPP